MPINNLNQSLNFLDAPSFKYTKRAKASFLPVIAPSRCRLKNLAAADTFPSGAPTANVGHKSPTLAASLGRIVFALQGCLFHSRPSPYLCGKGRTCFCREFRFSLGFDGSLMNTS
ncbi:hypothetical protein CDAR_257451 [Caerostris darwini]|uniref:Uncharacterized protein n=1 Tax=Caerostris darwini TaxID=1538125 RepID=A0AAV4TAW3_9ARAC|nr:hypothetical protein CDAR_257451 [Caerostris darwini]